METLALGISGMQSGTCAGNIEKRLYGVDGVQSAVVSFFQESAEVVYDPTRTYPTKIAHAVTEAGYVPRLTGAASASAAAEGSAPASRGQTNSGCG